MKLIKLTSTAALFFSTVLPAFTHPSMSHTGNEGIAHDIGFYLTIAAFVGGLFLYKKVTARKR